VAFIAMGLAQEQLGQSQDALAAFLKAEESVPESEIVQFFIGREYLFLAEFQPDQQEEFWQKAEDAYLKSMALNDQYAKAYLGLGSVYMKRSAELLDTAIDSRQEVDPRSLQMADQGIETYEKVLGLKPDFGLEDNDENLARLALGSAYRQKGATLLMEGDAASALAAFDKAIQFLESVRPVFESLIPDHESYRRYLVQSHEYLGTVYQWQGAAFEARQDYEQAVTAYEKSIGAFDQCVANGKGSPDLIIQNDIIQKYCQPKLEEIQQIYNELIGGN
jgi:tetratricopeptide (TPR) repeat protein